MAKFRKKPVVIEAEQYFVGKETKGVKVTNPEVRYSSDEKLFYVSHCDCKDWLSIEKDQTGKYRAYPFMVYEIKSSRSEAATEDHPLVKLYLEVFELEKPKPHAWVETIHRGQSVTVEEGDWIIPESDGIHFYPCKPDVFKATYEPV